MPSSYKLQVMLPHYCHPHAPPHVHHRTHCSLLLPCRYLVEDEVEQFMIKQLQDPKHEAYEDFKRKTKQVRGCSMGSGEACACTLELTR